jgi:hypothetical protein
MNWEIFWLWRWIDMENFCQRKDNMKYSAKEFAYFSKETLKYPQLLPLTAEQKFWIGIRTSLDRARLLLYKNIKIGG